MISKLFSHFIKLWIVFLFASIGLVCAGSYEDFFKAVLQNDSNQIKKLLGRGFDANTIDPAGQTGLHLALREPSLGSALVLLPVQVS